MNINKINFLLQDYRKEAPQHSTEVGIVDSEVCAFTTTDKSQTWIATIVNKQGLEFQFVPIDKNIPIYKSNGDKDKQCDGMLLCDSIRYIAFIELKDVRKEWIKDAIVQLHDTIKRFNENHNYKDYRIRKAYASNIAHPHFNYNQKEEIQKFKNELKFVLYIGTTIQLS